MNEFKHKYSPQGNPYHIPEGYFEQKQKELLAIANKPKSKITSIRQLSWISGLVAAALILAVYLFPEQKNATISPESLEEYLISEYTYGMTETAIFAELDEDVISLDEEWNLSDEEVNDFLDNHFDQTLHYEYY